MSESKLKHSYSLTSLSTRFLHPNGYGNHHHHHHHYPSYNSSLNKDSLEEQDAGDDYGFLSFREKDKSLVNGHSLSGISGSFHSSSSHLNNKTNSVQTLGNNHTVHSTRQSNRSKGLNLFGATGNTTATNTVTTNGHCNNNKDGASCNCDCHSAHTETEGLSATMRCSKNIFASSEFGGRSNLYDFKFNSSCQALNLCPTTASTNSSSSSSGLSSMTNGSSSSYTANTNNGKGSMANGNGLSSNGFGTITSVVNGGQNAKKNGVRVRRTISCYAKNPNNSNGRNSIMRTNYFDKSGLETKTGMSNGVSTLNLSSQQRTSTLSNPICEFSPYSSLSSSDLVGIGNGFIGFSATTNGVSESFKRSMISPVFFHDNRTVDCGCHSCFEVKRNFFQVYQYFLSTFCR